MEIEEQKFVDAGQQNDQGLYDYFYSGINYFFRDGSRGLFARTYDDTPELCSFVARTENEQRLPFRDGIPYSDLLFCQLVRYLIDRHNAVRFEILTSNQSGAYESIDLRKVNRTLELNRD